MNTLKHTIYIFLCAACFMALHSCDGTKHLRKGEHLLIQNRVVSLDKDVDVNDLPTYIKQKPNTKWFSMLKVPLGIYSMAGTDTTKAINRRLKKWGEAPVVLDTSLVFQSRHDLRAIMQNFGYLDADVTSVIETKGRKGSVTYLVDPQKQYSFRNVSYNIADYQIDSLLHSSHFIDDSFQTGKPFSVNALYAERNRITSWLNDNGYYYFNKECITFVVDSSRTDKTVDVTTNIGLYRKSSRDTLRIHPRYTIGYISYDALPGQNLNIRPSVLEANTLLESGDYYSGHNIQETYNKFSRLKAIRSTNVHLIERADTNVLDAHIQVTKRKPQSIQLQPEGTNTSGDFGAAISVTYENRNIFHGSEQFTFTARGAFEAIRGLEGYENSDYREFDFEAKLNFPKYILPWRLSRSFQKRHNATTEFPVSYSIQHRPEFSRNVLSSAWRYKWNSSSNRVGYSFDLIDLNFISMPWISETFKKEYLDSENNRNAILRYNYENLMIMKIGFSMTYSDKKRSVRANIETAGNVLSILANTCNFPVNEDGQYKVAKVAFAQYAKLDLDYTRLFKLDTRNTLALHGRLGIAVPYGNSEMLPFEKRYFSGGANSVRGWNVRTLGPGRYKGKDGRIDFINQSGDMKIDLNAELRTDLFWKFQGAVFIDAGNVWTLRKYKDQVDGDFKLQSLYNEMAVSYGLGLRLNFDYFIMRLDLGMKAINPVYDNKRQHFPIAYPVFSRDYALHFAVGLPF